MDLVGFQPLQIWVNWHSSQAIWKKNYNKRSMGNGLIAQAATKANMSMKDEVQIKAIGAGENPEARCVSPPEVSTKLEK